MRRFVFLGIFLTALNWAFSQERLGLSDTIHLEEIVSYGSLQKYQSGAKIEQIQQQQFELVQDGNLEQLLSRTLPLALKSDAGGISTIRIRGSAPNHTSVNFGGIELNSLTLGQSNISNVPLYIFDNVGVQFGGSSSVNGSGSIGGAIYLGLKNRWTEGFSAEIRVSNGSFGEQMYGTKVFAGNGKFESVTRAYFYAKKNDFPFENTFYRDFENQVFSKKDRQQNAAIENYGLLQELKYRFATNEFFFVNVWMERDWHLVQPNMPVNLNNPGFREELEDRHFRIWTGYKNRKRSFKYEVNAGYVADNSEANQNTRDTISTRRILFEAFAEHDISNRSSYKTGIKATRIVPDVYAYKGTIDHENRVDFFASYYQRLGARLSLTLNLRQGLVSDFEVPFTPSVGINYLAFSGEKTVLRFSGNIARSYRVPTFNDRFWVPGGNPALLPEKGMNYELGGIWSHCVGVTSGNIKLNVYLMNIDNWILWKNGGAFWYAENVQSAVSKGIELMTDWHYEMMGLPFVSGLNYSLTSAQRLKSLNKTNALNRQLEYVPLHSGNFYTTAGIGNFDFTVDGSYTDSQYTDEEKKNILDDYFLLNAALAYKWKIDTVNRLRISGMVNNILNVDYQSSWAYAMPGINYRISITYNFK